VILDPKRYHETSTEELRALIKRRKSGKGELDEPLVRDPMRLGGLAQCRR
jgi:hypothetical protein